MGTQTTFHASGLANDFLGLRVNRTGTTEIVYEDGAAHRMIWRVTGHSADDADLSQALQLAVASHRVVPAMLEELKKRAIAVERIAI